LSYRPNKLGSTVRHILRRTAADNHPKVLDAVSPNRFYFYTNATFHARGAIVPRGCDRTGDHSKTPRNPAARHRRIPAQARR